MKTPITYYGGKQNLVREITAMIPPHRIYVEPFFGGGAVFFAKRKSFLECINDTNDLLITFYEQCVNNFEALQQRIQHTLHSEREHQKARRIYNNPRYRSKLDRAWAVWVMTNMSVMATPRGGWKRDNGTGGSHIGVTLDNHRQRFTKELHERLRTVQISCHDAIDVIQERDSPDTFFYLDPPYMNAEQKHYKGYTEEDFKRLLDVLARIEGKFILSNFDSQILKDYCRRNGWQKKAIECKSMIPALIHKPRRKCEILVYNFRTQEQQLFNETLQ